MHKLVNGKRVRMSSKEIQNRRSEEEQEALKLKDYLDNQKYRDDRAKEYPDLGDQLDALMKQFAYMRLNGVDLAADLDRVLGEVLAVKRKFPKPKKDKEQ